MNKSTCGRKTVFYLTSDDHQSPRKVKAESQGRNLEVIADAENMKEC